jgi:hypothetical protein
MKGRSPAGRKRRWQFRMPWMTKNFIVRSRTALWLFLLLLLAATTMAGCVSAEVESGIFVVRTADGALERIGDSAGLPVWSPADDSLAWGNEDGLFLVRAGTGRVSCEAARGQPSCGRSRVVPRRQSSRVHRQGPSFARSGRCTFRSRTILSAIGSPPKQQSSVHTTYFWWPSLGA